jgi:hypothetical protein
MLQTKISIERHAMSSPVKSFLRWLAFPFSTMITIFHVVFDSKNDPIWHKSQYQKERYVVITHNNLLNSCLGRGISVRFVLFHLTWIWVICRVFLQCNATRLIRKWMRGKLPLSIVLCFVLSYDGYLIENTWKAKTWWLAFINLTV